jgi:hypothetical protein
MVDGGQWNDKRGTTNGEQQKGNDERRMTENWKIRRTEDGRLVMPEKTMTETVTITAEERK